MGSSPTGVTILTTPNNRILMGMLFTAMDMNTDYSRGGGHFYADRLDKIQDEISPEDLLWAGGYIVFTRDK